MYETGSGFIGSIYTIPSTGGIVTAFTDLSDVTGSYVGHGGEQLRVGAAGDGIEFFVGAGTDELVKVDGGAVADYIGDLDINGVIRTNGTTISKVDGGNFVTLQVHSESAIWNAGELVGYEIKNITPLKDQILVWDNVLSQWVPSFNYSGTMTGSFTGQFVTGSLTGNLLGTASYAVTSSNSPFYIYGPTIKEPTGIVTRSDSNISFSNSDKTFYIYPVISTFKYYVSGSENIISTTQSIQIDNVDGLHFIYFIAGNLTSSINIWGYDQPLVFIGTVYWDSNTTRSIGVGDERHGITMDWATHEYLHHTIGTRYESGFGIGNYTIIGDGSNDSHATCSIDNGIIDDEDLEIRIVDDSPQDIYPTLKAPIFYRSGSNGIWAYSASTDFPLQQGTNRIQFNTFNGGSWSLIDVSSNGDWAASWLFATNDIYNPIICILGQRQDSTFNNAINNNTYESLSFGTLPYAEMKLLYRLIFQTSTAYANIPNARLRDVQDLRVISNLPAGTYVATDHGSLSGLTDLDHPALAIYTDVSGFNGIISSSDTTVQLALDRIDNHIHTTLTGSFSGTFTGSLTGSHTGNFTGSISGSFSTFTQYTGSIFSGSQISGTTALFSRLGSEGYGNTLVVSGNRDVPLSVMSAYYSGVLMDFKHVSGTTRDAAIRYVGGSNWAVGHDYSIGKFAIENGNDFPSNIVSNLKYFVVDTSGRVGIGKGVISPSASLQVSGNIANNSTILWEANLVANAEITRSVSESNCFRTNSAVATTMSNFSNGYDSQVIHILFGDVVTHVRNNSFIRMQGDAGYSFTTAGQSLSLFYLSAASRWYEISRTT